MFLKTSLAMAKSIDIFINLWPIFVIFYYSIHPQINVLTNQWFGYSTPRICHLSIATDINDGRTYAELDTVSRENNAGGAVQQLSEDQMCQLRLVQALTHSNGRLYLAPNIVNATVSVCTPYFFISDLFFG